MDQEQMTSARELMGRLRGHKGLVALVLFGALLRLLVQVTYWPAEFNSDSHDYMATAFAGLLHPKLDVIRPSGYGLFLAALPGWRHLWTVTALQHLLGLVAAVMVYATALRWRVPRWGALLASAAVLLDPLQISLEQFILADMLTAFLVLAACVVLIWSPTISVRRAAIAGALLGIAPTFRTVAVPLLAVGLLVVVVASARRWQATAAFAAIAAVIFGSYVLAYHAQHGKFSTTSWGPRFLYARIGLYIDCSKLHLSVDEAQLCPYDVPRSQRTVNLFLWQPGNYVRRLTPPPGETKDQVLSSFDHTALRQQPFAYLTYVARDSLRGFAPVRWRWNDDQFDWQWGFSRHHQANTLFPEPQRLLRDGMHVSTWGPGVAVLTRYDAVYTPGLLLGIAFVAALSSLLLPRRGRDLPRLPVAVTTIVAGVLFVGPAATASFSWRYLVAELTLIPLAAAIGVRQLLDYRTPGRARNTAL